VVSPRYIADIISLAINNNIETTLKKTYIRIGYYYILAIALRHRYIIEDTYYIIDIVIISH